MGCVRRALAALLCVLMVGGVAACGVPVTSVSLPPTIAETPVPTAYAAMTPTLNKLTADIATPTPSVSAPEITAVQSETIEPDVTDEPEDVEAWQYDIPGMKEAGLTSEEYEKIDLLLHCALAMVGENGRSTYFNEASSLNPAQLNGFLEEVLFWPICTDMGHYQETDDGSCEYIIDKTFIEKVLVSAFGIEYFSQYPGSEDEYLLRYQDGKYYYSFPQGSPTTAHALFVERLSNNQVQVKFDIITEGDCNSSFDGKAYAVLEQDKDSIFGYHLVSLKEIKTKRPGFTITEASSWLPNSEKTSFAPKLSIDGKLTTGWSTDKGAGEWLKLSSDKAQTVSGVTIYCGDKTLGDEAYYVEDTMANETVLIKIELSDGSVFEAELYPSTATYDMQTFSFGSEIQTDYIKITIVKPCKWNTYIPEIVPF